jgi:hypothetical protein
LGHLTAVAVALTTEDFGLHSCCGGWMYNSSASFVALESIVHYSISGAFDGVRVKVGDPAGVVGVRDSL